MNTSSFSFILFFVLSIGTLTAQDLIERTKRGFGADTKIEQKQTSIAKAIQQHQMTKSKPFSVFKIDQKRSKTDQHERHLTTAPVYLKLDSDEFTRLIRSGAEIFSLTIPVDEENTFTLHLKEYNVFSDTFEAITSEGLPLDYSSVKTYRGFIAENPASVVSMTYSDTDVRLMISDHDSNYSIVKQTREHAGQYVLFNDNSKTEKREFSCHAKAVEGQTVDLSNSQILKSSSSIGCVDIYLEMDHDLYLFNGTTEAAVHYALSLFNEVATIYDIENIDINISFLKVWTAVDPYKSASNGDQLIDGFGTNLKNTFNGDLAHLLTGRGVGGGAAWLNVLGADYCSNCGFGGISTGPYGYSSGMNSFSPFPGYSWEVGVVAHELGHNIGSPHTHSCLWNGNNTAIDGCAPVEDGSCSRPGSPSAGGTIMSYCHNDPVGINLSLGFGPQPGNLIRSRVSSAINNNDINGTCSCSVACSDDYVLDYFGTIYRSSWGIQHPRTFADINGDGLDDIVGFANHGVRVALSDGADLVLDASWDLAKYGILAGGWNVNAHPRFVVDVNADGMDDIVGFAAAGVLVSTSSGFNFNTPSSWINGYGVSSGLDVFDNPRVPGDFNNDGLTDFVIFGNTKTAVILSTGTAYENDLAFDLDHYHRDQNWIGIYPRLVGDVDGDGFDDDIVGFGPNRVKVSKSDGTTFTTDGDWTTNFTASEGWTPNLHLRFLADVNGDGMDDAVGFANEGVRVGLSTGTSFEPHTLWYPNYGINSGWGVDDHPRYVIDINGDGMDDIVGFANAGVFVSLSTGSSFDTHFKISDCYGKFDNWTNPSMIRSLADFEGDGIPDIVAMGCGGTYVDFRNNFVDIENDICADAVTLQVNAACDPLPFDNIDYTASGESPDFSCGIPGVTIDSWYTVTVPFSGNVTIETSNHNNGLTDMIMQVLSGSCGAFTEVECDDDDGVGNHSFISITGRAPGEILYVRVVEYGSNAFGEFGICAYDLSSCPPNYAGVNQLSGTQNSIQYFETDGVIESNQMIGAETDYDSGSSIELLVGFEVLNGMAFHAFIDGCGSVQ